MTNDWPPVPLLLKELRGARTQEAHAAELGVAREQYNKWSRGKQRISQKNAEKLATLTPYPAEAWNRPPADLVDVMEALATVQTELAAVLNVVKSNHDQVEDALPLRPFLTRLAEDPSAFPPDLVREVAAEERALADDHHRTADRLDEIAARLARGGESAGGRS